MGHTREDFSPDIWKTIKILWESGQFGTKTALHSQITAIYNPAPSLLMICQIAKEEGWDRHAMDDVIEEKKKRNITEMLAEIGMDEARRLQYLVQVIRAADGVTELVNEIKSAYPPEVSPATDPKYRAELLTISETIFRGMKVSLQAQELLEKKLGGFAPEKVKVNDGSRSSASPQLKPVNEMTNEELEEEIKRWERASIGTDLNNECEEGE